MVQSMKMKLTAAMLASGLALSGTGVLAATLVPGLGGGGNDPFPASLNGSPSLAKCNTGTGGASFVQCSNWEDEGGAPGDYSNAFTLDYTQGSAGYSFAWTFDPSLVTGAVDVLYPKYVAVKQSNFYEVWLLDQTEYFGGSIFTTLNDISHVSFYNTGQTTVVPLPAAGWLMLLGIGGLAAMRRRKR